VARVTLPTGLTRPFGVAPPPVPPLAAANRERRGGQARRRGAAGAYSRDFSVDRNSIAISAGRRPWLGAATAASGSATRWAS
jgi:hypothetical protein